MAPKMTAARKAERDKRLVRDRAKKTSWATLAQRYDLSERQCRNVWTAWRKNGAPNLRGKNPIDIIWESVDSHEAWQERVAEILDEPEAEAQHVISAINTLASVEAKKLDLLQASGILPNQLGELRVIADVQFVVRTIMEVFREEGIPREVQERIMTRVREASTPGQG